MLYLKLPCQSHHFHSVTLSNSIQLEDEIDKMLQLDGLRRKNHVLEFSRLMVRAESTEHRLSLLKIMKARIEQYYHTQ